MGFSSGRIVSPAGFSGSVSGGGSLHGQFSSNVHTGTFSGHLSSSSGSGSFRRSYGCTGSFSMAKQIAASLRLEVPALSSFELRA